MSKFLAETADRTGYMKPKIQTTLQVTACIFVSTHTTAYLHRYAKFVIRKVFSENVRPLTRFRTAIVVVRVLTRRVQHRARGVPAGPARLVVGVRGREGRRGVGRRGSGKPAR